MEDYKELISLCDYWIGLSDENDKKTMDDQLLNRCKCAIEHLVEEYKILEWQNHLERCEHQHTKDNRDEIAKNLEDILCDYADVINENYDLKHKCDECGTKTNSCIVKLQEQLAKVTKERDAMLADLKEYASCECCKYINGYVDDEPCNSCVGGYSRNFEWRGVQE